MLENHITVTETFSVAIYSDIQLLSSPILDLYTVYCHGHAKTLSFRNSNLHKKEKKHNDQF